MSKLEKAANSLDKLYRGCIWVAINLFVLGFLCWGLYKSFVSFRVEATGLTTEGTVVRHEQRDGGTYRVVVSYDVNRETYYFTDDSSSNPPRFELGEIVTIRYDQANPDLADIDSGLPLWLIPLGSMGLMFIALIVVNIWGWRAWKRGEEML
jgi:hypothetical protein